MNSKLSEVRSSGPKSSHEQGSRPRIFTNRRQLSSLQSCPNLWMARWRDCDCSQWWSKGVEVRESCPQVNLSWGGFPLWYPSHTTEKWPAWREDAFTTDDWIFGPVEYYWCEGVAMIRLLGVQTVDFKVSLCNSHPNDHSYVISTRNLQVQYKMMAVSTSPSHLSLTSFYVIEFHRK